MTMFGYWKDFWGHVLERREMRKRQAANRNALHSLTDRELNDIGIARWQINDLV
jgi:uncharacterized protein YjiS (DUF1127 family)